MAFNIAAGLITQGLSSLGGIVQGISQRKAAKNINPDYFAINDPRLNNMASPYAQQMLGRAQMQVNARMPGAAQRERQLLSGTAGTQAAITRGATDMSSAMQGILAAQAMGADQINNQALMEAQFQQQREGQLANAQQTMIGERDKAFNAMNQKYMMDMDRKTALQNASAESFSGALSGLASGFFSAERLKGANAGNMGGLGRLGLGNIGVPGSAATGGTGGGLKMVSSVIPIKKAGSIGQKIQ